MATLAQALRVTAATVSDQVSEDDLVTDVFSGGRGYEILLTEKCSGGLGQMESIVREIKRNPRFFLDVLEHALTSCPRESWAANLNAVSKYAHKEHIAGSGALADAFDRVRNAQTLSALEVARNSLVAAMNDRGLNPQRSNVSAVSMKLLRPGSSKSTDSLTFLLNESWRRHSEKIGLEIPIRTFAYLVSSYAPSQRRLVNLFRRVYNATPTSQQLYAIIQQLLFESCADSCPDCLSNPNYFNDFGKPARALTLSWLSLHIAEVSVSTGNGKWMSRARSVLEKEGRVCLVAQVDTQDLLFKNVVPLFFEELNVQSYRESVHISRVERTGGRTRITLNIRDFTDA